jgi:V8-like Glu-specific endopeptidase
MLTLACEQQVTQEAVELVTQASICGSSNDMQNVEQYNGLLGPSTAFAAAHQSPVFNLKWKSDLSSRYTKPGNVAGARWCTGTMLTADIGITAGHCFDIDGNGWTWPRNNSTGTAITSAQGALEMLADFNYQVDPSGRARAISTFNVSELVEYRLGNVDYAVVRLSGNPGATFGTTTISSLELTLNDIITIIQHPEGQLKKIHAGPVAGFDGNYVAYSTADTLGGSSGSGVLNTSTGYVQAIHTNGGCTSSGGANQGVRVLAITAVSPTVRTLSFDAAKMVASIL